MSNTNTIDVGYPVSYTSIEDCRIWGGPDTIKPMLACGGFMSMNMTQEHLDLCHTAYANNDEALAILTNLRPGPVITVMKDFLVNLTNDEYHAVLLHEAAHISLGHLSAEYLQDKPVERGVVVCEAMEIEADAYAAEIVGGDIVRSALLKLLHRQVELIVQLYKPDEVVEDRFRELLQEPSFVRRLAALSNTEE